MPLPLDGPWAKVDRAIEHLNALNLGCQVFLKTKPYYIAPEFDPDAGCHIVYLRVRQAVPLPLSVVVGDFVHDLRSALDQAAWLIACRSNPVEELWKDNVAPQIAWPFIRDPAKTMSNGFMERIAQDARAVLNRLQPHKGTDLTQALCRLDRLWNIDKHRVIHGGFARIDLSRVRLRPGAIFVEQLEDARIEFDFPPDRIAKDRTPIARAYFSPPPGVDAAEWTIPQTTKVRVNGEPAAEVFFGAGGGGIGYGITGLAGMVGYVSEALGQVAALPEKPPP